MLFQFEGRGIKNKCMKRVDGNKEHFIWAENDEDDENIMMKMKFWVALNHCILPLVEWKISILWKECCNWLWCS